MNFGFAVIRDPPCRHGGDSVGAWHVLGQEVGGRVATKVDWQSGRPHPGFGG